MGKGLGWLQREILDTLQEAKQETRYYFGAGWYGGKGPGWVKSKGHDVLLQDHVYDLRASERFLAKKHQRFSHATYISSSFQSSFSRAVKGLLERGLLQKLDLVPIQEPDEHGQHNSRVMLLADGWYLDHYSKRVRFVVRNGHYS
jgi:hypothetical protein